MSLTPEARARIRAHVAPEKLFEASAEDAAAFCINAVNIGHQVVMARATPAMRALLTRLGYTIADVELAPFILSGGAAYCMSLRLDRQSQTPVQSQAQEFERHDLVGS